jgi:hypothetical protein
MSLRRQLRRGDVGRCGDGHRAADPLALRVFGHASGKRAVLARRRGHLVPDPAGFVGFERCRSSVQ